MRLNFLYWLCKYFCGSCLWSLGLSFSWLWEWFGLCTESQTVLNVSGQDTTDILLSALILTSLTDLEIVLPVLLNVWFLLPSLFPLGESGEVKRWLGLSLWLTWGHPWERELSHCFVATTCRIFLNSMQQRMNFMSMICAVWCCPLNPRGDTCNKIITGVSKSSFF